ncbi:MAG: outer membrane protein assembly factor BamE [Thermoanaerobaculia bacterium]
MPKRISRAIVAVLALALVAALAVRAAPGVAEWAIDGGNGFLNGVLFGEDTVFADGYTAEAFRRVEAGMTRDEVHTLLGEPLATWTAERIDWNRADRWSLSPGDTHYRMRTVYYAGDRVVEKIGQFYAD